MKCKICGMSQIKIIWDAPIRKGTWKSMTAQKVIVYQCCDCGVIWHINTNEDLSSYYKSEKYRKEMRDDGELSVYWKNHDKEVLEKLIYTGTDLYRNRLVADVGCGGGSFLDFIRGAAKAVIGIEPTEKYRMGLEERGIHTFAYANEALMIYSDSIDVITSWDVIEHVEAPVQFMKDIYTLMVNEGNVIIGTPTEQPLMRNALGPEYDKFLFSTQHLWIFNEESLRLILSMAGFKKIQVRYFQRYGLSNLVAWLKEHQPMGNIQYNWISDSMNQLWIADAEKNQMADYLVAYAEK